MLLTGLTVNLLRVGTVSFKLIYEFAESDSFEITPQQTSIDSLEYAMFEIKFKPTQMEQFYYENLTAKIDWLNTGDVDEESAIQLPLSASIKVLGFAARTRT